MFCGWAQKTVGIRTSSAISDKPMEYFSKRWKIHAILFSSVNLRFSMYIFPAFHHSPSYLNIYLCTVYKLRCCQVFFLHMTSIRFQLNVEYFAQRGRNSFFHYKVYHESKPKIFSILQVDSWLWKARIYSNFHPIYRLFVYRCAFICTFI